MNIPLAVLIVLFVSGSCTGCSPSKTRKPVKNAIPAGTTAPLSLNFSTADIIACDLDFSYAASHIFLATSHMTVLHATGPNRDGASDQTRLVEEDFKITGIRYTHCKVITDFYDKEYASECGGRPLNITEIIRRADSSRVLFRGKTTHYDKIKCNCEHWVSSWRYGSAWTLQLPKLLYSRYRSDNCEAPGKQGCL